MSVTGQERECPTCEVRDFVGEGSLIPVWENPDDWDAGEPPDYLGCTECHTMKPFGEEGVGRTNE